MQLVCLQQRIACSREDRAHGCSRSTPLPAVLTYQIPVLLLPMAHPSQPGGPYLELTELWTAEVYNKLQNPFVPDARGESWAA